MKLSHWPRVAVVCIGFLIAAQATARAQTFNLDPVHSTTIFAIHHFNAGYVWGFVGMPTGSFTYDASDPTKLSFNVSASLDNLDTQNARRDSDLKGPDWFNAKQYPTITFKSTAAKKTGDDTYDVTGDLTLHGVTKSITVSMKMTGQATAMGNQVRVGWESSFTINRGDYDMKTMPGPVGEDVRIIVALDGIQQ